MSRKKKKPKSVPMRHEVVAELVDGVVDFLGSLPPIPTYSRSNYFEREIPQARWDQMMEDARKRRAIRDMKKLKFLKDRQKGNAILVLISTDALVRSLQSSIQIHEKVLSSGRSILILFDFPNGATKARNRWRQLLLSCDFEMIQLSSYATKKDVLLELRSLVSLLGVEKWVSLFVCEGSKT